MWMLTRLLPLVAVAGTVGIVLLLQSNSESGGGEASSHTTCTFLIGRVQYEDEGTSLFAGCQVARGRVIEVQGLSPQWLERVMDAGRIVSGQTEMQIDAALAHNPELDSVQVTEDSILQLLLRHNRTTHDDVDPDDVDAHTLHHDRPNHHLHHHHQLRQLQVTGTRRVLVVRVIAKWNGQDNQQKVVQTTETAEQLTSSIFGTDGDKVNLRKQMKRCSNFQLDFAPAAANGLITSGGVITVTVFKWAYAGQWKLLAAIEAKLEELLGNGDTTLFDTDKQGPPGKLGIDHVMFCMPKDTIDGVAWAFLNHWMTVYNDDFCSYPSAQMHEIGHNLGLHHSGEGDNDYADQSGMMGFSYRQDESPRMCFNGAKTWQLGWYKDRHATWDGKTDYTVGLVGTADYKNAKNWHKIILRVVTGVDGDFYVWFNRKYRFNRETVEGGDQVLIVRRIPISEKSTLVAKLGHGQQYALPSNITSCRVPTVRASVKMNDTDLPPRAFMRITCA